MGESEYESIYQKGNKMNYYCHNGNIFSEQNMQRAKLSLEDAQLLTQEEVEMYLTNIKVGYQKVSGKLAIELIPIDTPEQLAQIEQKWVISQLTLADRELQLSTEQSSRAKYTVEQLYTYKEDLRNYILNVNGTLAIDTDKPLIKGGNL